MKYLYAPGCALMAYKPHLADKLKEVVTNLYGEMDTLLSCCFTKPQLEAGTQIVTPCATCAEKYNKQYSDCSALFVLSAIAESKDFPFPDYGGQCMSIQDTCSARSHPEYLATIRRLLERMNIQLVEPAKTGQRAKCCGQVFYGKLDINKVEGQMKIRANEMPCEDVVVYCASCIMSMTVGGKQPRYILDLLFNEPTEMRNAEVDSWNKQLKHFRETHKK